MRVGRTILWILSLGLAATAVHGGDFTQYVAHFANGYGWNTQLDLQNANAWAVTVDITAYDDNGGLMTGTTVSLPAHGFRKAYIQDLLIYLPAPSTGSLFITSHEPGSSPAARSKVNAIVVFGTDMAGGGPSMAGLASSQTPAKVLHFPWFENSTDLSTGIAVLNTSDYPITVFLRATEADGTRHESETRYLGPRQRIIQYPGDLFPGGLPEDANLSAYASGPIAGFLITHHGDFSRAEAVGGVPEAPALPTLRLPRVPFVLNPDRQVSAIRFSPDGTRVYVRGVPKLRVYDRHNGALLHTRSADFADEGAMAISPDGRYLYTNNWKIDHTIYRIDTETYADTPYLGEVTALDLQCSPDGRYLGILTITAYYLWDVRDNHLVPAATFTGGTSFTQCIFTADSRYFLAADSGANMIRTLDLATFTHGSVSVAGHANDLVQHPGTGRIYVSYGASLAVFNYPSFLPYCAPFTACSPGGGISHLAISPDGRLVYIGYTTGDHGLYVYDTARENFTAAGSLAIGQDVFQPWPTPEGDQIFFSYAVYEGGRIDCFN